MSLRDTVRTMLRKRGFDIVRYAKGNRFNNLGVDTLFDVGANIGQFAKTTRQTGYTGKIVSFEPLTSAYSKLSASAKNDPKWIVHSKAAMGKELGTATINIAQNSYSSSILPMLDSHKTAAPESAYIDSEQVDVTTLAEVFPKYRSTAGNNFLKIDTQGFERQVLEGSGDHINDFVGVQLELSLAPLYEGAETYDFFVDYFRDLGFTLWDLETGFRNTGTGQLLQADGVFVNEKLL